MLLESVPSGKHADDATLQRRARLLDQLARAIEAQDPYIDGHSRRVARHAAMIASKMRLPAAEVGRIRTAGALHDVGKLSTPAGILGKPARLTAAEYEVVKLHAVEGARMVACLQDDELRAIVRHHHERMDGSGYPDGLNSDEIPLGARIVAVADIFDAITAPRPYRPPAPHRQAFRTLSDEAGTRLDAGVVHAFMRCYSGRSTVALWAALRARDRRAGAHTCVGRAKADIATRPARNRAGERIGRNRRARRPGGGPRATSPATAPGARGDAEHHKRSRARARATASSHLRGSRRGA
jgi:putative nucleotidyltransferase with HDIG domain